MSCLRIRGRHVWLGGVSEDKNPEEVKGAEASLYRTLKATERRVDFPLKAVGSYGVF